MNAELIRQLTRPQAYPHEAESHITLNDGFVNWTFQTGQFAYRVKKPVRFGDVLDFRTLDSRETACRQEVELNKTLGDGYYLSVEPIKRTGDGLKVGRKFPGTTIEFAVKTRQLPRTSILTNLVRHNLAHPAHFERIARLLEGMHRKGRGKRFAKWAGAQALRAKVDENFKTAHALGLEVPESYKDRVERWLKANQGKLDARAPKFAVDGHGDLRCDNVFVLSEENPAKPPIIMTDRVYYNESLRMSDQAEDVAFMAMDLDHMGRSDLGAAFVDAYLEASKDVELLTVLNFFKGYRAMVRAKVHAYLAHHAKNEIHRVEQQKKAKVYLQLAMAYPF